jgi:hypothetical protein
VPRIVCIATVRALWAGGRGCRVREHTGSLQEEAVSKLWSHTGGTETRSDLSVCDESLPVVVGSAGTPVRCQANCVPGGHSTDCS